MIGAILTELEGAMVDADFALLAKGEERWRNRVRQERRAMVDDGLIEPSATNGIWVLTPTGRRLDPDTLRS